MTVPPEPRPGDDGQGDIDAEFARMMEGLDVPDPGPVPDEAPAAEDGAGADGGFSIPDDLSALEDPDAQPPALAVIGTAVASAKALAAALKLSGAAGDPGRRSSRRRGEPEDDQDAAPIAGLPANARVLDTDMGAILIAQTDEEGAHALAETVSTALQQLGVLLLFRSGDRMTATRYQQGRAGDDVPPAIVLGGLDPQVEKLMLGSLDASALGEGIDPAAVTTMQALRWIATGRKRR